VRRGFKTLAKGLAIEVRGELGLNAYETLDPVELAETYGIPIYCLGDLERDGMAPESITYFDGDAGSRFSAALIPVGPGRCIVENDGHAPTRRRANLAHEMAHVILEHDFTVAILGPDGCRSVDPEIEEELGGELLITSDAALRLARRGAADDAVARYYGVSTQYAAMRMNRSGARTRAGREASRRRRRAP
jgi:hypothetical protein